MDLALDLLQGAGLAGAIGIRPLLPVLLAGALAAANLGIDFEATRFEFLEKPPFLFGILVLVVVLDFARRRGENGGGGSTSGYVVGVVSLVLGSLLAAGSVADRSPQWWLGAVVGVVCAALGFLAARNLFERVRRRLDADAAKALPLYGEGMALAAAGSSVLFPPLALVVVGGLIALLIGGRRVASKKYAGLRVLR